MTTEISPKQRVSQEVLEKRFSILLGALIGLLLAALFMWSLPFLAEKVNDLQNAASVQYAPNFELEGVNLSSPIALADYEGKGVVLNFWASWCHPCREEMPALEAAWKKYESQGIVFIGVNSSDNKEQTLAFLEEYGLTYPNGVDAGAKVSELFQIQGLPTTWFVAADGSVAKIVYGPLDLNSLDENIALILPEGANEQ